VNGGDFGLVVDPILKLYSKFNIGFSV